MSSENPEFKIFGEILREQRRKSKLSQEELAEATEFDRTFISRLERGLTQPSLTSLVKLASALGVPASTLVKRFEIGIRN